MCKTLNIHAVHYYAKYVDNVYHVSTTNGTQYVEGKYNRQSTHERSHQPSSPKTAAQSLPFICIVAIGETLFDLAVGLHRHTQHERVDVAHPLLITSRTFLPLQPLVGVTHVTPQGAH